MQNSWLRGVKSVGRFVTELDDGSILITTEQQENMRQWAAQTGQGITQSIGQKLVRFKPFFGLDGTEAMLEAAIAFSKGFDYLTDAQKGALSGFLVPRAYFAGAEHVQRIWERALNERRAGTSRD